MSNQDKIKALVRLWYQCLIDHHKDRDCHFYIETKYSYAGEIRYNVMWNGYVQKSWDNNCESLEHCEFFLITKLKNMICIECNKLISDDTDNTAYAEDILKQVKDI